MQQLLVSFSVGFGNPRGNENVFLMAIGVMWFRYHNYFAEKLANENPEWSDQMVRIPNLPFIIIAIEAVDRCSLENYFSLEDAF